MTMAPRLIALLAVRDEEDIIAAAVRHLIAQGAEVYVLDDGSTDGTVAELTPLLGKGVLRIERFPAESGISPAAAAARPWECLLRRKEQLAGELAAEWFIHHDADELRESPWDGLTLREAIARVDRLGYNAVDFAVYNFPPVHDAYRAGDDLARAFPYCEPAAGLDRLQVKCWKKQPQVDLASSGGHEARFPGQRVFPVRFLCRHYPLRGQVQGERKLRARRARFAPEHDRGWHCQYDGLPAGGSLRRDPATLTRYDEEQVKAGLLIRHRDWEQAAAETAELARELARCRAMLALVSRDLELRTAECEENRP